MKEFDLEKAKAGHPVCTRDGRPARILCFDAKGIPEPIIALIDKGSYEMLETYRHNGKYLDVNMDEHDLMMAGEKKEGWVNIYKGPIKHIYRSGVYDTFEMAYAAAEKGGNFDNYVATTKIEWEE